MTSHKAPIIGMLALVAVLIISSLGGPLAAASWHTIQTDIQTEYVETPVFVWDGGGADNLASTAANWVGDVAPFAGGNIYFNSTSTKACTWDITSTEATKFGVFQIFNGYTGTITQAADMYVSRFSASGATGATFTPSLSYELYCYGDFTYGGVITNYLLNLYMRGEGATLTYATAYVASLHVEASITLATNLNIYAEGVATFDLASGKTLTINSGCTLRLFHYNAGSPFFTNSGSIAGTGALGFNLKNTQNMPALGTYSNSLTMGIVCQSASTNDCTVNMTENINCAAMTIQSYDPTYRLILDMKGYDINTNQGGFSFGDRATLTSTVTGALMTTKGWNSNKADAVFIGTYISIYIREGGTMAAYSGQTFPVVWGYKTYPGTITLQTAVSITNFKIITTQATTNYRTYLDGIRFREGNTDGSGYFVIGTSTTTYAAGTYYTFQSVASAWYVIQNDSAAGFTFQVTAWHTIQNDSKSIYFYPYDFHTIQADSTEYRIGQLITAQEFNGTLQSSGTAPIVEPGTDTETNIMGIIWLLVFFLPAILLFAYLGKLGGTVGIVLMSVVSAMAFDMGIFIMVVGIISAVIIMVESDGGD